MVMLLNINSMFGLKKVKIKIPQLIFTNTWFSLVFYAHIFRNVGKKWGWTWRIKFSLEQKSHYFRIITYHQNTKQDWVALLITDPEATSSTTLSKTFQYFFVINDMWHVTHDVWHTTCMFWRHIDCTTSTFGCWYWSWTFPPRCSCISCKCS